MHPLPLFLPCAAGVEPYLADEVHRITGLTGQDLLTGRGGVLLRAAWRDALRLNLHSRLAQRVLVRLAQRPYRSENDLYAAASEVAWESWFTPRQSFKVEATARNSPLQSLNFAALKVKDAVADRFRTQSGVRPDVNTQWPDVRIHLHLSADEATIYIDTSGEPLFKRGWREETGAAPLKETLAAAMLAASGWDPLGAQPVPLYDPCCGSGTIAIEAAQIACRIPAGMRRRFAFEKLLPFQAQPWTAMKDEAAGAIQPSPVPIFGSDVAFRMVDFAARNAQRAGVADAVQLRGGDALQRQPPCAQAGVMLLNPPYGERIAAAGVAGGNAAARAADRARGLAVGREAAHTDEGGEFLRQLATHWKRNYAGWTAWILTPDPKLPGKLHLQAARRVPLYNGPIECRLLRFDLTAGSMRTPRTAPAAAADGVQDPAQ
ncbi:class I SAM-dependent RNA methyltransferase [Verminephrobacter aporrectodeae subsp. tuberculatae]|uniref:THUMP domain-containing class I SAM-dependent RNA methyltransferase n=1 Tax=Verminephrobacter aporrectodeae TaxID=1110389 RepID=UPI002237CC5A|nr:THUMP domain-containing protein [Verminephrobacter aporrectodeae]MCW5222762.1 class I SAM-dependent RNA methyltransferase [Verminephrobacter aporrectodeae subsp. tuberculatae]MCW5288226.1 class I SAM-dependent RNA methyltransferase [Verminephrobacter aporrectodeae subsp. tuberculatae]